MKNNSLQEKNKVTSWVKPVVLIMAVALLVLVGKYVDLPGRLREVLEWIQGLGWLGVGFFVLIYILACVFMLPGSILTLGAGAIFGVVKGSVIVSVASILGATCAFLVGRYLARDWVARRIKGRPVFEAIDEAISGDGWKVVVLTRLSPILPFNMLNYGFGLTRVKLRDYVLASWVGMLPGTVMFVYIGSLAGSLATVGSGERQRTTLEWVLYAVGLVATIIVTVYVTRVATRKLKQNIHIDGQANE